MAIPRCEPSWSSIPDDIALQIASFLEAADVCSLGSCSRFWREICVSDFLWMVLAKRRWHMMDSSASGGSSLFSMVPDGLHEGAAQEVPTEAMLGSREFYIHKHRSIAHSVSTIIKFVERCTQNESIEVGYYLKAVEDLHSCRLSFKDVQLFLFARRCSVLLNLVGLHYALIWLKILPQEIMEALHNNGVSDREVFVSWFKLGRWFYGFRLHDEHRSHKISLLGLVMNKDDKVLRVLNRGAVHEVIRVYITPVKAKPAESSSLAEERESLGLAGVDIDGDVMLRLEEEEEIRVDDQHQQEEASEDDQQPPQHDRRRRHHRRCRQQEYFSKLERIFYAAENLVG